MCAVPATAVSSDTPLSVWEALDGFSPPSPPSPSPAAPSPVASPMVSSDLPPIRLTSATLSFGYDSFGSPMDSPATVASQMSTARPSLVGQSERLAFELPDTFGLSCLSATQSSSSLSYFYYSTPSDPGLVFSCSTPDVVAVTPGAVVTSSLSLSDFYLDFGASFSGGSSTLPSASSTIHPVAYEVGFSFFDSSGNTYWVFVSSVTPASPDSSGHSRYSFDEFPVSYTIPSDAPYVSLSGFCVRALYNPSTDALASSGRFTRASWYAYTGGLVRAFSASISTDDAMLDSVNGILDAINFIVDLIRSPVDWLVGLIVPTPDNINEALASISADLADSDNIFAQILAYLTDSFHRVMDLFLSDSTPPLDFNFNGFKYPGSDSYIIPPFDLADYAEDFAPLLSILQVPLGFLLSLVCLFGIFRLISGAAFLPLRVVFASRNFVVDSLRIYFSYLFSPFKSLISPSDIFLTITPADSSFVEWEGSIDGVVESDFSAYMPD